MFSKLHFTFRSHGRYLCSKINNSQIKTVIAPWKWNNQDKQDFFLLFPATIGSGLGTIWGAYEGFEYSKKEIFVGNLIITSVGGFWGYWIGFFAGGIWPISLSVALGRLLYSDNNKKDENTKKEN